jgi:PST family polysaccharide transporter
MLLALARVVGELVYDFLVALGLSKPNLAIQVVWLVALAIALPIGVRVGGIEGVAIGHAIVAILVVGPMYAYFLRRAGVSLRQVAVHLSRPLAGTAMGAGAGAGVVVLVSGGVAQLLVGGALVGLVYLAVVYPMRAVLKASVVGSA